MARVLLLTLTLLALAGAGAAGPAAADGSAMLRVMHASPDAGPLDVTVDGGKAISALAYGNATPYRSEPAGPHRIGVFVAGLGGDKMLIDTTVDMQPGQAYTLVAADVKAKMAPVLLTDTLAAAPAGKAYVRLVHASPDAPAVADVAVVGGPVVFHSVPFKGATAYLAVDAGTYQFEVRPAGQTPAVATTNVLTLEKDRGYTVFALGLVADTSFEAVLVPDNARTGGVNMSPAAGAGGLQVRTDATLGVLLLGAAAALLVAARRFRGRLARADKGRG